MSLTYEKLYPWLFAIAAGILAYLLGLGFPDGGRNDVLSAGISISSIFAGFLATAKAILMAMPESSQFYRLKKKTTYGNDLADYLRDGLAGSLAFALVGLVGYFHAGDSVLYFAVWLGLAAFSISAFWRVSTIMVGLLKMDVH